MAVTSSSPSPVASPLQSWSNSLPTLTVRLRSAGARSGSGASSCRMMSMCKVGHWYAISSRPSESKSPTTTDSTGSDEVLMTVVKAEYASSVPSLYETSMVPRAVDTTRSVRPSALRSPESSAVTSFEKMMSDDRIVAGRDEEPK